MAYICKDCSYRGVTSSQSGGCPACGSYHIEMLNSQAEEKPPPKWRLVVLISLWGILLLMIAWKLVN